MFGMFVSVPEWSKGYDSSSYGFGLAGSNPARDSYSLCSFACEYVEMLERCNRLAPEQNHRQDDECPAQRQNVDKKVLEGFEPSLADSESAVIAATL